MTKVVIAAAGQGTRMLHLTDDKSKPLIKVNDRPFLSYLLDNIFKAGYRDVVIVIGYKQEAMEEYRDEAVKEFANCYLSSEEAVKGCSNKITLVNQYEILGPKEKEYGTACPIKCVKDIVGNDNFIYLSGDNLYSVRDLKSMDIEDDFTYIGGIKNDHPEKYGVLLSQNGEDEGLLKEIIEKPKTFVGNIINGGIYNFTPEIFKKVFEIQKSPRGEYEVTDAVNLLAKENKVKIKKINDFWLDFGNPGDITKVSQFIDENGYR